jgi:DNA-binding NarL/FixJ family response regulator
VTIRVLVVDDQELVRAGFSALLRSDDLEVVGEAGDGREAVELACAKHPDVILMMCGCRSWTASRPPGPSWSAVHPGTTGSHRASSC